MSRLTITLEESRYRALKEAAAVRNKTIGQLIDESLDFYGVKSNTQALDLVRHAREQRTISPQALITRLTHQRPPASAGSGSSLNIPPRG